MSETETFTATAKKLSKSVRLGFKLQPAEDGGAQIQRMSRKGGVFVDSQLQPGMKIVKINSLDVSGRSVRFVSEKLASIVGMLTIEAVWPYEDSSESTADSDLIGEPRSVSVRPRSMSVMVGNMKKPEPEEQLPAEPSEDGAGSNLKKPEPEEQLPAEPSEDDTGSDLNDILDSIVTVTATKTSKSEKVGIKLTRDKRVNILVIEKLNPSSIFWGLGLTPGMEVLSINDVSAVGKTVREMSAVIAAANDMVTIVAGHPPEDPSTSTSPDTLMVTQRKTSKSQKVGIRLARSGDRIILDKITEEGLFHGTGLVVGMQVLAINDISTKDRTARHMTSIILNAESEVKIHAVDNRVGITVDSGEGTPFLARKFSKGQKVGLKFAQQMGNIVVASVSENSIFIHTGLKAGMRVVAINQTPTRGKSARDVSELVKNAEEGPLEIRVLQTVEAAGHDGVAPVVSESELAAQGVPPVTPVMSEENEPEGTVVVTARKRSMNEKLGLTLNADAKGIVIGDIKESSMFYGTALKPQMRIVSINGHSLARKSNEQAAKIIKDAGDSFEIKAFPDGEHQGGFAPLPASRVYSSSSSGALTFTAQKTTQAQKVGVRLSRERDRVYVKEVSESSIFNGTGLKSGMKIESINGVPSQGQSASTYSSLVANAVGPIVIVVSPPSFGYVSTQPVVAAPVTLGSPVQPAVAPQVPGGAYVVQARKPARSSKVGVRLSKAKDSNGVFIGTVTDNSIFKGKLVPGMRVVSINGLETSRCSVVQLSEAVAQAEGIISMVVMDAVVEGNRPEGAPHAPQSNQIGPGVYEYKVYKADLNTKIGLKIKDDPRDPTKIVVSSLATSGLFTLTTLKAGMHATKVNGQSTGNMTATDLSNILRNSSGSIVLEMVEPP